MNLRNEIWTYLTVTGVTLIIWLMAERATRQEDDEIIQRVVLRVVGSEDEWTVKPSEMTLRLHAEGSVQSIRELKALQAEPLVIDVPQEPGEHEVNFEAQLPALAAIRDTIVDIRSVEPPRQTVSVDRMESATATVRPVLPNVKTVGPVEVSPSRITLRLPSRLRAQLTEDLHVEAFVDPAVLQSLPQDELIRQTVRLRLPEALLAREGVDRVQMVPDQADMTFTLVSRIRELTLDTPVRVHLAGPPEDFQEYDITLEPAILRNVKIAAETTVIQLIESRRATVVAVLHLSNQDKAQAIPRKSIAYFQLLGEGWTEGIPVQGWIGDDRDDPPVIALQIKRRE